MSETVSILGHRVNRVEDPKLLTTGGTYNADVELPTAPLHVAFVRSVFAHGRIDSIDTDEARNMPGVVDVITSEGLGLDPLPAPFPMVDAALIRPLLASDIVRFMGEPIAIVVATSHAQAVDAAETVFADIEPLDVILDPRLAVDPGSQKLFHDAESNVAFERPSKPIDVDGCDVVVEATVVSQRIAGAPIETRSACCYWDGDRLVQYASSQSVHTVQTNLMDVYDLDADHVRVVNADVGGAFGVRGRPGAEELVLGAVARRVGAPVRWNETRSESLAAMGHGRAQHDHVTLGGTSDGRLTHYRLEMIQEVGAYPSVGAVLPMATGVMGAGPYAIENVAIGFRSVVTNTAPVVAYRGAGRPEATGAMERAVDLFARSAGIDPIELRRRNFIADDAFPYDNGRRVSYDSGRYGTALDAVLESAGYDDLVAERDRRIDAGDTLRLGIGVASYVEITGGAAGGGEHGRVALAPDGTFDVYTGSTSTGQGHATAWSVLAADRLGVPLGSIRVHGGDTAVIPTSNVTGGSRSLQIAGAAVADASEALVDRARQVVADRLEANVDDIVHDSDGFHVAGSPTASLQWSEVADAAESAGTRLDELSELAQDGPSFPFGSHVAVVEVDTETGSVSLRRLIACDDAGTVLHPALVAGQVHGGLASGAAQALFEEVVYDEDGNLLTSTLAEYLVPSAADLPPFERVVLETPSPLNPLGAKGIGESGTIGSTAAVHNAVLDALAPFGIEHLDMPLTPHKIWSAISR